MSDLGCSRQLERIGDDRAVANAFAFRINCAMVPSLVNVDLWPTIPGTDLSPILPALASWTPLPHLAYQRMDDFLDYHPSIEVSRGCGRGCSFCEERSLPLSRLRPPDSLVAAMNQTVAIYGDNHLSFYLESSSFSPCLTWAQDFALEYSKASMQSEWRCEARVDTVTPEILQVLSKTGLRVIDLGLESASPSQLLAMHKTPDPAQYLAKASALLQACRDLGIWPKVNVMLYAGETDDTLTETVDWLYGHSDCVKGVSVGPVVVYGHGTPAEKCLSELRFYGASVVDPESMERDGHTQLNLSPSFDHEKAEEKSLAIAKMFMTDRDYYDLKHFTYLERGYTYQAFRDDSLLVDDRLLPFRIMSKD